MQRADAKLAKFIGLEAGEREAAVRGDGAVEDEEERSAMADWEVGEGEGAMAGDGLQWRRRRNN